MGKIKIFNTPLTSHKKLEILTKKTLAEENTIQWRAELKRKPK